MKTKAALNILMILALALTLALGMVMRAPAASTSPAADPPAQIPAPPDAREDRAGGEAELPEGVSEAWWSRVQEEIQRSEYEISWGKSIALPDLPAAYQAPNRAQGLRTTFAPDGIRVIPRTEEAPSWQFGLGLVGYDTADGSTLAVGEATLQPEENRIAYHREATQREALREWYLNDERGLQQGLVIPPAAVETGETVLEMAVIGDLTPELSEDGTSLVFSTGDGKVVLRYGELAAVDAAGQAYPVRVELVSAAAGTNLRLVVPAVDQSLSVGARLTSVAGAVAAGGLPSEHNWERYSSGELSVSTAGDVNGDGYSDIIVGGPYFGDNGAVWVWYGGEYGLCDQPTPPPATCEEDWWAQGEHVGDLFGRSVGTVGDVNGDGYSDIIVGAHLFDNGETNEGKAYVWYGSEAGLGDPQRADWTAQSNQSATDLGFAVGGAGDVNGDGYGDVIIGGPYFDEDGSDRGKVWVWYGSAGGLGGDGTADAADWWAEGDNAGDYFGGSVGTAGDVNGDGYSDIIVGTYDYTKTEGTGINGAAYVWYGSADGLGDNNRTAGWWAEGEGGSDNFGRSVGTAGDVNGDGYSDVIVGAHLFDNGEGNEGKAYVWYGSEDGLGNPQSADWTAESNQEATDFGFAVGTAGDVNGDGYSDIIVGGPYCDEGGLVNRGKVWVWYGKAGGLGPPDDTADNADWWAQGENAGDYFGGSVGTAGDVNGDGYSDIIAASLKRGAAYVYHGSPGGPILGLSWSAAGEMYARLGYAARTAGDVNGDGYGDVIVGAPSNIEGGNGKVFVWYGTATGLVDLANPDWEAVGENEGDEFGYSVAPAGDVNGDGYADVIVGAHLFVDDGTTNEGKAYVWHGSETGLGNEGADWTAESNQSDADFGFAVGTAGDVDGDGYSDIIVGGPYYDADGDNRGKVWVWYGSAGGLGPAEDTAASADWWAEGEHVGDLFGRSVGTAGDVNGDGCSDIIVGAHLFDNGETNEGKAYVWHGSATGLGDNNRVADWTAESNESATDLGFAVGTAGDVDGDGYTDIIVGGPYFDEDGDNRGKVWVWYGSAGGLGPAEDTAASADWWAQGDNAGDYFGGSVGTAGDVNSDGYSDIIVGTFDYLGQLRGAAYVWYGSADGLGDNNRTAGWWAEGEGGSDNFGRSVGTAGDVNGDGYSDIIVGAPGQNGDDGAGFVYHGSGQGLSGPATTTLEGDQASALLGAAVSPAGDINGDGYADVIVGAPNYDSGQLGEGRAFLYRGSEAGLAQDADWFAEAGQSGAQLGFAVSTAGDVNGDGYSDVIIAAPYYDDGENDEGAVFVWLGSDTGLGPSGEPGNADWKAFGNQAAAFLGFAVATAGDVNNDGYGDVIVGAKNYDNGHTDEGRAAVWHGGDGGLGDDDRVPDWTAEGDQEKANLGNAVGGAGDVDGDGFSDVIVGADKYDNGQTDEGRVFVFRGGVTGLSAAATWTAESDQANANLGHAVGSAGDVNGDGYADIIVGAYLYERHAVKTDEGAAFAWYGAAGGLGEAGTPSNADWMVTGDQKNAQYGYATGSAGDVNGDGYADVIVGAAHYTNGPGEEGRAFVYHGTPDGLSMTARWTGEANQESALFGTAASTAGDVNGDGYADVVVGAPNLDKDAGLIDSGGAFVYLGNGGDCMDLRPQQTQVDDSTPIAPLGRSDSENAVGLRLTGRTPLGRDEVKLQWQVAPLGIPFAATAIISGTSPSWIDTGDPAVKNGVEIAQTISGLSPGTLYHWRARLLYRPGNVLGVSASRWVHVPWNGWHETDFHTSGCAAPSKLAFDWSPATPTTGQVVTFSGAAQGTPPLDYAWAFGDGGSGEGASVVHTYVVSGTYNVVMTVTGPCGAPAAVAHPVSVSGEGLDQWLYLPLVIR